MILWFLLLSIYPICLLTCTGWHIESSTTSTRYAWVNTTIIIYCKARIHFQLFLSGHLKCIIMRGFHEQIPICLFSLLLQAPTPITAADICNYSLPFTKTPNKFPPSKVFWSLWKNQASTLEEQQLLLIISWLLPNLLCHPCERWRNLYKILI